MGLHLALGLEKNGSDQFNQCNCYNKIKCDY